MRAPFGDLAEPTGDPNVDRALRVSSAGGAAPVAFVRHGLDDDVDLGVQVSGSDLSLAIRGQLRLDGFFRLIYGIGPHLGLIEDGGVAARGGVTVPVTLAIDVLSLFEVWLGARASLEHGGGELGDPRIPVGFTTVRAGGVVGLAAGFRRFHVLVELGIDHEAVFGHAGDTAIERNGLVLTPAFALRLRL